MPREKRDLAPVNSKVDSDILRKFDKLALLEKRVRAGQLEYAMLMDIRRYESSHGEIK